LYCALPREPNARLSGSLLKAGGKSIRGQQSSDWENGSNRSLDGTEGEDKGNNYLVLSDRGNWGFVEFELIVYRRAFCPLISEFPNLFTYLGTPVPELQNRPMSAV
jgi:hypothetical protein